MRVVVLQPSYLPWIGYMNQMAQSDMFIFYDDVQYDKHSWRNRNRIKTSQGIQWLTVPVKTKGQDKPLIKDVLIDNNIDWRKSHLKSIQQNYSRAPYFDDYFDIFQRIYFKEWDKLIDLNITLICAIKVILGIKCKLEFSSQMNVEGDRIQRLVNICLKVGANEFLEGDAGKNYLEGEGEKTFNQNGIKLIYHNYQHPTYNQLYGDFVPYLSVIDLIFNHGKDSLDILMNRKEINI